MESANEDFKSAGSLQARGLLFPIIMIPSVMMYLKYFHVFCPNYSHTTLCRYDNNGMEKNNFQFSMFHNHSKRIVELFSTLMISPVNLYIELTTLTKLQTSSSKSCIFLLPDRRGPFGELCYLLTVPYRATDCWISAGDSRVPFLTGTLSSLRLLGHRDSGSYPAGSSVSHWLTLAA